MKTRRNQHYRKNKNTRGSKKTRNPKSRTMKRKGGFLDKIFKKNDASSTSSTTTKPTQTPTASTTTTGTEPKKYGSITSGITTSIKRSAKAYNMPAILGAMSTKLNALLIHNRVNYKFSNGYNARDYDIASVPADGDNDGRGILKLGSKRGEITGIQSKVYNIASDKLAKKPATTTTATTNPVVK